MQADSIRAVLFDFGGVLVEEGFREGLSDLARQQGLNPQAVHQAAYDAIYESGYVLGRGTEDEFWNLLCRKVGLCGDIEPLRQAIAARFALRPLMLGVVRALRRRGYVTAILSDQTDWLDRMDAELHFFQDFDIYLYSLPPLAEVCFFNECGMKTSRSHRCCRLHES